MSRKRIEKCRFKSSNFTCASDLSYESSLSVLAELAQSRMFIQKLPSAYSHFYLAYKVGLFFCSSTPHSRIAVAPRSLEIGRIYHGLPWECTMVRAEEIVHANIASASSEDLGHAQISITHILLLGALRGEPNWNLIRVFNGGRSTETFSKNQHPLPHFHERSALRGFFAVVVSALQKMVNHPRLLKSSTVIVFPNCPEVAHAYTIDTAIWESGVFR